MTDQSKARVQFPAGVWRKSALLSIAAACVCLAGAAAQAGTYYDTNAGGTWGTATIWTPNGVPTADDWVNIDQNVTVAANQSFGDSTGVNVSTSSKDITINPGVTLTHVAGSKYTFNGQQKIVGGGKFVNNGAMTFGFRPTVGDGSATTTFENNGTLEVGGGAYMLVAANSIFRMGAGSTITKSSGTGLFYIGDSGILTSVDSSNVLQAANFVVQAGTLRLQSSGSGGQVKFGAVTVATGATFQLGAAGTTWSAQNASSLAVDGALGISNTFRLGSDITVNAGDGTTWSAGDMYLNGYTLTNASGAAFTQSADLTMRSGTGTFLNKGTYTLGGTLTLRDSSTFNNQGLFTSAVTKTISSTTNESGTLLNTGTVQVTAGTLTINTSVNTTNFFDVANKTLTSGTWKVLADPAGTAVLTIADANTPKITTIGPDATVVLQNTGAVLTYLEATLTTVNGKLLVNGTRNFTNANTITVGSTGTLGGNGTYTTAGFVVNGVIAPGASIGTLTFDMTNTTGVITLNSGAKLSYELGTPGTPGSADQIKIVGYTAGDLVLTNNIIDFILSGSPVAGDHYRLFSFFAPDGLTPVLHGLTSGLLVGTGLASLPGYHIDYTAASGTAIDLVIDGVVPEPASLACLAAGFGLMAWRPRGKNRR